MNALLIIGLTNAVLASLLAGFVYLISRRVRHAPLMHILWLLVLLKFIMPPILSLKWRVSDGNITKSPEITTVPTPQHPVTNRPQPVRKILQNRVADEKTLSRNRHPQTSRQPSGSAWTLRWDVAVGAIWIAGSVIWMIVAATRILAFRRVLKRAAPAPPELQHMCRRLVRQFQLQAAPRVLIVDDCIPPLLCGLFRRPVIVIPADLLLRLDQRQQETLLTHELAHLRRGDRWVRLLELLVLALYWWHPVAWWTCRQLREFEETCCDGWVLRLSPGLKKSYARSLLATVEFLSPQYPALPPITSGFGSVKTFRRRLEMVLQNNTRCQTSWIQRGYLTLFAVEVLLFSIAFVPDNTALAQREKIQKVAVPSKHIHSVSFSADGKLLAGGSWDTTVKIWDATTGDLIRTLKDHKGVIRTVAFAPHGSLLASGSDDRTVILWDAKTGKLLRTLEGFKNDLNELKFSADGKTLWAASSHITSWDVETGTKTSTIKLDATHIRSLDLSPDNKYLAVGVYIKGKHVTGRIYDIKSGNLTRMFGGEDFGVYAVCFSPDGKHLAGTCYSREDGPSVQFWDIETGEVQKEFFPESKEIFALKFSPDGKLLASGGTGPVLRDPGGSRVLSELTIWDPIAEEGRIVHLGASGRLRSLWFSPDGKRLAYCDGATVSVIDVDSGEEVWTGNYGAQ